MNKQKEKTARLVVLAALAVIIGMVVLFRVIFREEQESSITLPPQTALTPAEDPVQKTIQEGSAFVTLTPENLTALLSDLTAPDAYYQAFTVTLTAGTAKRVRLVQLWSRSGEQAAVVYDETTGTEQHFLAQDDTLWVWYTGDAAASRVTNPKTTLAALCSLPDGQDFLAQWTDCITETTYETLDTGETAILIAAEDGTDGAACRLSADTGLPLFAQAWDADGTWYEAVQTEYRLLTPSDMENADSFALP